ncbi:MAG: hypothetical protein JWP47_372 [Polaromonas sp.]|nr:hypothetical protein [Polaromonas sp.]
MQRILVAAAAAVIVGQLVALGMVAQEQVHQADRRASQRAFEQAAHDECFRTAGVFGTSACLLKTGQMVGVETSAGPALHATLARR